MRRAPCGITEAARQPCRLALTLQTGMRFVARHSAGTLGAWRHRVAAIDETLARQWSPVSPIGERVRLGDREWVTIIAVVSDTRQCLTSRHRQASFYRWTSAHLCRRGRRSDRLTALNKPPEIREAALPSGRHIRPDEAVTRFAVALSFAPPKISIPREARSRW
jgi:hypothetical protein